MAAKPSHERTGTQPAINGARTTAEAPPAVLTSDHGPRQRTQPETHGQCHPRRARNALSIAPLPLRWVRASNHQAFRGSVVFVQVNRDAFAGVRGGFLVLGAMFTGSSRLTARPDSFERLRARPGASDLS